MIRVSPERLRGIYEHAKWMVAAGRLERVDWVERAPDSAVAEVRILTRGGNAFCVQLGMHLVEDDGYTIGLRVAACATCGEEALLASDVEHDRFVAAHRHGLPATAYSCRTVPYEPGLADALWHQAMREER